MTDKEVRAVKHRGISAHRTNKGFWIMDSLPPKGFGYWSRFFTQEEIKQTEPDSSLDLIKQEAIIRLAIDRALAGKVVFPGDIREQFN